MSLKLVVIDNCAFSGEYCKQFVQFVVRHKAPHGILGREGYHYILCPRDAASYDWRYRALHPPVRLGGQRWCVPHSARRSLSISCTRRALEYLGSNWRRIRHRDDTASAVSR